MEFNKNEEEKQDTSHLFNETEEVGDKEKQYFTIDRNPRDFQPNLHKNPYEEAGFFSLLFFNWVNPLINFSQNIKLSNPDLDQPHSKCRADVQKELVLKNWTHYKDISKNPLLIALIVSYKLELLIVFIYNSVRIIIFVVQPFLMTEILEYIQSKSESEKRLDYCLAIVLVYNALEIVSDLILEQSEFIISIIGINGKNGVSGLVYDKVLRISGSTNKEYTHGEIVNFINIDVEKIMNLAINISYAVKLPFEIIFGLVLLFYYFQFSLFASIGLAGVFIIISHLLTVTRAFLQRKAYHEKDKRMEATNEAVNNIKLIKFNSLVDNFIEKILHIRDRELFFIKLSLAIELILSFFGWLLSSGLIISSLLLLYLSGDKITVSKAYAAIQVFKLLEVPIKWFPIFINYVQECIVSTNRIHNFLLCKEYNPKAVSFKTKKLIQDQDLRIEKANFTWGGPEQKREIIGENNKEEIKATTVEVSKSILFQNLNLAINEGEFICIIGEVGSGKSSLISAIIGDMIYVDEGTIREYGDKTLDREVHNVLCDRALMHDSVVKLGGSLCVVQQPPWIQNKTIRDNILFGLPFHKERYIKTIESCQLVDDLAMLNGGDMTEIGERGVNLSGGQKARISLARAVYSGKDIVLMDDPISSLDSNVKQKVFEEVLCGELKHKTRILVTHAVDFLHLADRIVIMEKGNIKLVGTYEELKQSEEIKQVIDSITQIHLKEERMTEEIENEVDKTTLEKIETSQKKCDLNHEIVQIIENENNEIIEVGFKPYIHLFGGDFNWITYLMIIPFLVIFAYFGVQSSYYLGIWIKNSEKKEAFWSNIITVIYYVIGFTLSRNLAAMLVYYSTIRKSRLLHERMIRRVLNAPINTYFDKTPSGTILNRFSRDLSKLDEEIFRAIISLVESITSVIYIFYIAIMNTYIIVTLKYSVWVLLILPVMILLLYLVIKQYLIVNRELSRLQSVNGSPLINHFDETLNGLSTIRAFEKQKEFAYKNEEFINTKIKSCFWKEATKKWFSLRVNLLSSCVLLFTSVFCVVIKDSSNAVLMGMLFTNFIGFNKKMVVGSLFWADLETIMVLYHRCMKTTKAPQEDQTPYNSDMKDWPLQPSIEFINFTLKYRPETEIVLHNISFKIEANQKIGVVGRTGAGKSTLCLALCRIIEATSGQILIDGVDISKICLKNLREKIAIIPQDPTLFEGTLRQNIDPYNKASNSEIIELLKHASLENLIERHSKGLDQQIEAKAYNLSSGEKQIICICRAIIRNCRIVLIDEATASIDIKTEKAIHSLISEKFNNATVITIAHRLNTIMKSDKILVLDMGEVVEFKSPKLLSEDSSSMFYSFLKKQDHIKH